MTIRRFRYLLPVVFWLWLVAGWAYAEVAVSVDAIPGFDGYFRAGDWAPITLSVRNLGRRFEGDARVSLRWGERFSRSNTEISFSRAIKLPRGGGELVPFVLPLNNQALPVTVEFVAPDGTRDEHEITLRSRPVRGRFVVALSRRPDLDFLLRTYGTVQGSGVTVAYPLAGYLPVDSRAFDSVDVVVLHDVDLSTVDEARLAAIERWVYSGGRLVVSGGPSLLAQTPGPVERFLPGEVLGLSVAAGAEGLVALEETREIPIVRIADTGATVLAESNGIPLVTEDRWGNGSVVFLAFDYASLNDRAPAAGLDLWNHILREAGRREPIPVDLRRRIFETPVLTDLLDLPLYEFPEAGHVVALVVAYVVTTAMIFALGRGRVRWTVLPLALTVSIGFGLGAYFWLNALQQPSAALFMEYDEIVSEPDRPISRLSKDLVVFSTQRDSYEVALPGGTVVPLQDRDLSVREGEEVRITDIDIGRWSLRNYHVVDVVALSLAARAEKRASEVQVVVTNRSNAPIEESVVVYRGQVVPVGEMGPRQTVSAEFVPRQGSEPPNSTDGSLQARARERVISLEARRQISEDSRDATIIGFLPASPLPATPDRDFARRFGLTVVRHRLEVME